MRRTLAAVLVLLAWFGGRAWAHPGEPIRFEAPVPASVVTPYHLDSYACIGCTPDGLVRQALRSAGYDRPLINPRALIEVCDRPFPPGAWDEHAIGDAPENALQIEFHLRLPNEVLDWDGAICAFRGPTAWELRADPADEYPRWRLEGGALELHETLLLGECALGCLIDWYWPRADPGAPYKLIAYNWSGLPSVEGAWHWNVP